MTAVGQGQHLVEVHDHLRAELDKIVKIVKIVGEVRRGSRSASSARSVINETSVRQNNWSLGAYCATYIRLVTLHHSLEDSALFPRLRAIEPALAPVIDTLESDHGVIHEILNEFDDALVRLLDDSEALDDVGAALDALVTRLRTHLSYEEEQLVPPLDRHGFGF